MKGGVGKSTIAVNTAFSLASQHNKRTLLVDLDPQFNATQYVLGLQRTEDYFRAKGSSVVEIFENPYIENPETLIYNIESNLDVLPSTLELSNVLKNPAQKEHRLSKFLKSQSANYDYAIIDCSPTDSMLTLAAYLSSNFLLIPVRPEFLSIIGLPLLIKSYSNFTKEYSDSNLKIAGIVVNYPSDRNFSEGYFEVHNFAKENSIRLFNTTIKYSKSYVDSSQLGTPIFLTPHARENKKMNFQNFICELLEVTENE